MKLLLLSLLTLGLMIGEADAARCAAGVYRVGCVGPRGGFVAHRRYAHPYARRCVWRAGRRIC
jgi:hypothetical protein